LGYFVLSILLVPIRGARCRERDMITTRFLLLIAVLVVSMGRTGLAQPLRVQPFGNGGVSIDVPGNPPITLQAFGADVMINAPGQPPSVLRPTDTAAVLERAGQLPITVQRSGSMLTISAPGAPPVTCMISVGRIRCR
jgi:hypothetical protein